MKKWKNPFHGLPRSVKAILNVIGTMLLLCVFYISLGSPVFTPEQQFRREEKSNLVGPAKILDIVSLKEYSRYNRYDELLLATSSDGVTLFWYDREELVRNEFVYRKKMGDITVLSLPGLIESSFESATRVDIPIVLFDSFPEAAHAEMEIELAEQYNDNTELRKVYTLTSDRDHDGYFLFNLSAWSSYRLGREGLAIYQLTYISDDDPFSNSPKVAIPITVRFFDKESNMICERSLLLRSPAGEAHASEVG